jgi:chromosome segregation ATPase
MDEHVEFKDSYQDLEAKADDIAHSLSKLPIDYKLADRCAEIEFSVEDIKEWYDKRKKNFEEYESEKKFVLNMITTLDKQLRDLNNDVEKFKLLEFSHDQHGGSYSRLPQIRRP